MSIQLEISALRQVLVKGRVSETLTGRGLSQFDLMLDLIRGSGTHQLPVEPAIKPQGYFGLSMSGPGSDMVLPAAEPVTLRLSVTLPDGRARSVEIALTGADLTPVNQPFSIGGGTQTALTVPAAPVRLDCAFDPLPVTLFGTVIANNDPAVPVAGATITAGTLSDTSDARGNFRLGPLPLLASLDVSIIQGPDSETFAFRPDFTTRTNTAIFSLEL